MRHTMLIVSGALAGLLLAAPAGLASATDQTIHVEDAWARRAGSGHQAGHGATPGHAPAAAANGAVYMKISNRGTAADALVSATTEAAEAVELHETVHDAGVMRMRPRARLEIPAGTTLELRPGGYHIMLLGLRHDLHPGGTLPVTLGFERAGSVTIEATVR
jgi:hypothetical protein